MNKKFNPGDSVVVVTESGNFVGIVSIKQLENPEPDFVTVDIEMNDDRDRSTILVHISYVFDACIKCYGKGNLDLGSDIFIPCDCCDGSGIENNS